MLKITIIFFFSVFFSILFSCSKKAETTTPATNIATEVVANLSAISASYAPPSLTSASISIKGDPCAGVTNFAICQSNLIREYNRIGKSAVDSVNSVVSSIGQALGNIPDGNSATSSDGKATWNKINSTQWSILFRGSNNQPQAYVSINGGTYIVKTNENVNATAPKDQQVEITVTFVNSNTWDVDVFFSNNVCDSADPKSPSKARLKVGLNNNLWTGKVMLYAPRWEAPGAAAVTCNTTAGASEIAMYTDYVGNSTSSKASLYMIPATNNNLSSIATFDLSNFCANFGSSCGGAGQPTSVFLGAYPNPFCSTGPSTNPTWGNACTTNSAVNGASYSNASLWVTPSALKTLSVTVPSAL